MKLSEATYFPDAKELTRHGFVSHMEDFVGKLIGNHPLQADVDDYLKGFDIDSKKALEILTKPEIEGMPESAVVIRSERIKNGGKDEFGKPMKDEFQVIYKVPKKDPERGIKGIDEKLRNLYIKMFENHIIEGTVLNEEDGGMTMGGGDGEGPNGATTTFDNGSGQYTTPCFGMVSRGFYAGPERKKKKKDEGLKLPIGRKTMYITEEQFRQLKEAVEMDTAFGDFGYDAPGVDFDKDDESLDHKNLLTRKKNKAVGHKSLEESDSGIHINPENKGKFTATKKRTGKSTEELTHSKNPLTRKRAIFAQNCRKWNHKKK